MGFFKHDKSTNQAYLQSFIIKQTIANYLKYYELNIFYVILGEFDQNNIFIGSTFNAVNI